MSIDKRLAELFTDANIEALRFAAGQQMVTEQEVRRLMARLERLLKNADLLHASDVEFLIKEATKLINQGYKEISAEQVMQMRGFAPLAASGAVESVNAAVGISLLNRPRKLGLDVSKLLIDGAPSADWWAGQAYSVQKRFARVVRSGFARGLTTEKIAQALVGKLLDEDALPGEGMQEIALRDARSLVHTSIQTVASASRREAFRQNADIVIGIRQISTLDSHTTLQCQARDQKEWSIEWDDDGTMIATPVDHKIPYLNGVPVHWGCRSVETSVLKPLTINGVTLPSFRTSKRASADGPVDSSLTFEQWLEKKDEKYQNESLGKGRAELWRAGKITLSDLLDLRGNPLTLEQLREKYA